MNKAFQTLLRWSESNKKMLTNRFMQLKRSGKLDRYMHQAHDQAFEEIDCLDCAACCKTVGPLLRSADVDRLSKRLKLTSGDFIDQYLRTDEDGDLVFQSMPCPFLLEDNRCSVYEDRPKACRDYPHTDQRGQAEILELTRKNARVCPAVARMFQIINEEVERRGVR